MSYDFIQAGEQILKEGSANMQQSLGNNKGGKLILTDRRIIFKAHALNIGSKLDTIELTDIAMTGNTINLLTPSPNMIQVQTKDGKKYQFVVTGKEKDAWLKEITAAADKLISSGAQAGDAAQPATVYQEITRTEDAKKGVAKWFSDYKKFGSLSIKDKLSHILVPVVVVIAVICIFSMFSSDEYVDLVRNGELAAYDDKTVGEAFDNFFADGKWESFEAEDGELVVEFNGVCEYDGEEVDFCMQFEVDEDGEEFEVYAAELDGDSLSNFEILAMLEVIYEE